MALLITLFAGLSAVDELKADGDNFRVLSWNISGDAFVNEPSEFHSLLSWANPDVVLLDEVHPSADISALTKALKDLRADDDSAWHINFGTSGGGERSIIASRFPQEIVGEFSEIVTYPDEDKTRILALVPLEKRSNEVQYLNDGIPVNGAVVVIGDKRLLVVITDLRCCGDGPESAPEIQRRSEARIIRQLIRQVLKRVPVDGIVFAGDFNLVESTFPMSLLTGPFPAPHSGLIPAEIYHPDGITTWTWDGRGTPFPSNTLDYQFYGPWGLNMRSGFILNTENLSTEELQKRGLDVDMVGRTGNHRPLVVEYSWK